MKRSVSAGLLVFALVGCSERWDGFIYPSRADLTTHVQVGQFGSLEECRDHCLAALENRSASSTGDYECGLNCKGGFGGMRVCEKTSR